MNNPSIKYLLEPMIEQMVFLRILKIIGDFSTH